MAQGVQLTPEQIAEARALYEADTTIAWTIRAIAAHLGVSHMSVLRYQQKQGWRRHGEPAPNDAQLEAARRRAQQASDSARLTWALRREEEANEAGRVAGFLRDAVVRSIANDRAGDARAYSLAYGVFVGQAQLLTGGMVNPRYPSSVPTAPEPDEEGVREVESREVTPADVVEQARARELRLLAASGDDA